MLTSLITGMDTYYAAGDLTCRAPNAAVTCAGGSPTGAVMGYDNERRLTSWQSAPSTPGATAGDAYDGEGHRVALQVSAGGTTTTTYYVAGLEEQANVSGGTSTLTKYYSVPGVLSAVNVGGTLSLLASDGLGSVSEALSATSAAATSQQLYGPYGGLRYATGNMPTAKGYTGQYADASSSGLDYYNARYYDPLVGQFASADSTADGLNRYGYVAGNPETATDPSGHRICDGGQGCGGDGGDGGDGGRLPPPPGGGGGGSGGCKSENCGGGSDGSSVSTPPKLPSKSAPFLGVEDWGQFLEGILEVGGSFAALGAAIWAEFQGSPIPGAIFILQQGVKLAGAILIKVIHDGIQHIINAFGGKISPWARVALDVLNVIGDLAVLATSGFFFRKAVMERGPAFLKGFWQRLGWIMQQLGKGATTGVYGAAAQIIGPAFINMFAGVFAFADDVRTTVGDIQTALGT